MSAERFSQDWDYLSRKCGYGSKLEMFTDMYVTRELSLSQIGERLGCTGHAVLRQLRLLNIERRGKGGNNSTHTQARKLFFLDQRVVMLEALLTTAKVCRVSSTLLFKYRHFMLRKENHPWISVSSLQSPDSNVTQR